jgi:magnesium chelatase family protein
MVIVGLPDTSVKESKERVLSAMHSLDCDMTEQKVVVNLSPSEQKKSSPLFDLAIAIGILKERGKHGDGSRVSFVRDKGTGRDH